MNNKMFDDCYYMMLDFFRQFMRDCRDYKKHYYTPSPPPWPWAYDGPENRNREEEMVIIRNISSTPTNSSLLKQPQEVIINVPSPASSIDDWVSVS